MSKLMSRFAVLVAKKEIRDNKRYTQAEIANATGLSPSSISRLMKGDIEGASMKTVRVICEWLECEVGELIYLEREPSS
jgi:DNA-binding Xre family transcriptional regulator